jgi:hypothetical protein
VNSPIAKNIVSVLNDDALNNVLSVLDRIGLMTFLKSHPLESLIFEERIFSENRVINGQYEFFTQIVRVSVSREKHEYNVIYRKQRFWSISSLANNPEQAYVRTLIHELGHHLHRTLREVDKIAFRSTMTVPNYNALSQYGLQDNLEYFAECFAAFIFQPVELLLEDSLGYDMITRVLEKLNLNLKEMP